MNEREGARVRARVEEKHLVMATVGVPVLETATKRRE